MKKLKGGSFMKVLFLVSMVLAFSLSYGQNTIDCNKGEIQFLRISNFNSPNLRGTGNYIFIKKEGYIDIDTSNHSTVIELFNKLQDDSCDLWSNLTLYSIFDQEATYIYAIYLSTHKLSINKNFVATDETIELWRQFRKKEDIIFWKKFLNVN